MPLLADACLPCPPLVSIEKMEDRKERGSYKQRFPAHHRRRKQLARSYENNTLAPAPASAYVVAAVPASASTTSNSNSSSTLGFGIIDWADSVLDDLDGHGGWAHRKRHVKGDRRRARHSADEVKADRLPSRDDSMRRAVNQPPLPPGKHGLQAQGNRCVTESPRSNAQPPMQGSPDSFLTRLRRVEGIKVEPPAQPTVLSSVPSSLIN